MNDYNFEANQLLTEIICGTPDNERYTKTYQRLLCQHPEDLAFHLERYDAAVASLERERAQITCFENRKAFLETKLSGVKGFIRRTLGKDQLTWTVHGRIERTLDRLNKSYWEKFAERTKPHMIARTARSYVEMQRKNPFAFTA